MRQVLTTCIMMAALALPAAAGHRDRTKPSKVSASAKQIRAFFGERDGVMTWRADSSIPKKIEIVELSAQKPVCKALLSWEGRDRNQYGLPVLTRDGTRVMVYSKAEEGLVMIDWKTGKKKLVLPGVGYATHVIRDGKEYLYFRTGKPEYADCRVQIDGIEAVGKREVLRARPKKRYGTPASFDGRWVARNFGGGGKNPSMVDTTTGKEYKVPWSKQRCQFSMAWGNKPYRIAHMQMPHNRYHFYTFTGGKWVRDAQSGYRLPNGYGYKEINWGRFSVNHPDYHHTAGQINDRHKSADRLVFNIRTGKHLKVIELAGGYDRPRQASLFVGKLGTFGPGDKEDAPSQDDPLAGLKLDGDLAEYRQEVRESHDWSRILASLSKHRDAQAKTIVQRLESYGQAKLNAAAKETDPLVAMEILQQVASRFSEHEIGDKASKKLASKSFGREVVAARKLRRLQAAVDQLVSVDGAKAAYDDKAFFQRNEATLVRMTRLASEIRQDFDGTPAAKTAAIVARKYALPAKATASGNRKLVVQATLTKTSPVPSLQEIAPYRESIVYMLYRVDKVISGDDPGKEIVVVHWGMRDGRHTPAAKWKPGLRQVLTVDLLNAHADIESATPADNTGRLDLTPMWALKVETLQTKKKPRNDGS